MSPSRLEPFLMYQRLPSAPATRRCGGQSSMQPPGKSNAAVTPAGVILPTRLVRLERTHRLPSGPTMRPKRNPSTGAVNSVTAPAGAIRPIRLSKTPSMNQRLASGPATMPNETFESGNSVIWPAGVIRPTRAPPSSVNQRLPSGPATMLVGKLLAVGSGNSVTVPAGVIRPIRLVKLATNQRLPSGPATRLPGTLLAVGSGNSVTVPNAALADSG